MQTFQLVLLRLCHMTLKRHARRRILPGVQALSTIAWARQSQKPHFQEVDLQRCLTAWSRRGERWDKNALRFSHESRRRSVHKTVGGRASLSAPESLTRVHEDITSQVRVSGTERDASISPRTPQQFPHTQEDPLQFKRQRNCGSSTQNRTAFQKRACESNEDSEQQPVHADEAIAIQGPHPTQNFHN